MENWMHALQTLSFEGKLDIESDHGTVSISGGYEDGIICTFDRGAAFRHVLRSIRSRGFSWQELFDQRKAISQFSQPISVYIREGKLLERQSDGKLRMNYWLAIPQVVRVMFSD
ncbi:hypothetical protein [Pontibacter sp. G13]|uniref:hypothetical protein n=1 Tax=Pontibacter sp. G13 TaxID=3074898 RepID=UPI00288C19B7|nr:hypothetical protein [Pontibacter sp. G13]WNJ17760.1 hypothetical protein RJD25_23150 [Pontibacter sp. G13]